MAVLYHICVLKAPTGSGAGRCPSGQSRRCVCDVSITMPDGHCRRPRALCVRCPCGNDGNWSSIAAKRRSRVAFRTDKEVAPGVPLGRGG